VATEGDQLVPPHQIAPIMNAVSSRDKLYHVLSGGHTGTSVKNGKLPDYLHNWLTTRSNKIK
jgi:polyhydroxyalkanoate synthase